MPSISDRLTVIITTSPAPSNPATDLIASVLQSFQQHCAGLTDARVVVVFDTFARVTSQPRLKKGYASPELAESYALYKRNIKALILQTYRHEQDGQGQAASEKSHAEAEFGFDGRVELLITRTRSRKITFIEPVARLGFGLAVRSALRVVETPYVWVQQHDWALEADIPLEPLLEIMQGSEADDAVPVKYVSFPSVRMKRYAVSPHVTDHAALRELTTSLKRDFVVRSPSRPERKIALTPLFFWFDKPHVASTAHYLARVFPTPLAMRRGEFIEDKIGQRARAQMKEGQWAKWATWLYYPDEGDLLCLRHLMGRTWRGFGGPINVKDGFHIATDDES
ncbi:hypothetical protein LV164_003883 [Aspergillus fumigatus]|nr:hypothetical protein KXX42_004518 [Aspergillus fumigatus]KAH1548711.1 hypothetical protein KXX57_001474 [Aspergillus fumigatus]KAH1980964.1 hypothetical protein KXW88_006259 [Aspergillus fumigatus]KAH2303544.1 hypothetical protein KXV47_000496 [Aspergillus fumigatus]KAH2661029.1 hypothetical protein KXV32_000944 [Aspergillus fumigatus]